MGPDNDDQIGISAKMRTIANVATPTIYRPFVVICTYALISADGGWEGIGRYDMAVGYQGRYLFRPVSVFEHGRYHAFSFVAFARSQHDRNHFLPRGLI